MSEDYSIVDVDGADRDEGSLSGTLHVNLTEELGTTEMTARVWMLSPGDEITYHRETTQEELYYAVEGPGRMRLAGEVIDVPENGAVRVPPQTPRQVLNDTDDEEHIWLIVGAPPSEGDARYDV